MAGVMAASGPRRERKYPKLVSVMSHKPNHCCLQAGVLSFRMISTFEVRHT